MLVCSLSVFESQKMFSEKISAILIDYSKKEEYLFENGNNLETLDVFGSVLREQENVFLPSLTKECGKEIDIDLLHKKIEGIFYFCLLQRPEKRFCEKNYSKFEIKEVPAEWYSLFTGIDNRMEILHSEVEGNMLSEQMIEDLKEKGYFSKEKKSSVSLVLEISMSDAINNLDNCISKGIEHNKNAKPNVACMDISVFEDLKNWISQFGLNSIVEFSYEINY